MNHVSKEYDEQDPDIRAYIKFARGHRPRFRHVDEARRDFRIATQQIARIHATYSGCDWCDDHGGGFIELGLREEDRDAARKYLEEHGGVIEEQLTCHRCWSAEGTVMDPELGEEWPLCEKCSKGGE